MLVFGTTDLSKGGPVTTGSDHVATGAIAGVDWNPGSRSGHQ